MASFTPNRIDLTAINNGKRYENGDFPTPETFNAPIEAAAFAQNIATNNESQISSLKSKVEKHSDQIFRNTKAIENLESQLNPDLIVFDKQIAYAKEVPIRSAPYAEITKFGGMSYNDNGTLRHAKPTAFKSVGVNLWDEQWERGYIDFATGIMYDDATVSRSKNFIQVKPNTSYYMYNGSWEQTRVGFYDKDFRILGGDTANTFTTPSECRYIKFYWLGTVYNHDICINKSDSSINGKYYPYKQPNILAISPAVLERCDGYGYGVNANAYNYVDWVDKKYHKVLSTANIGSYDWLFGGYYAYPNVSNFAKPYGACIANVPSQITNYYINDSGVPVFIFNQGDYANADEVKSAMQGVMLVYELATPEVIDIPDLPDDNLIAVEGGGTIIAVNKYEYAVPSEITYQLRSAT